MSQSNKPQPHNWFSPNCYRRGQTVLYNLFHRKKGIPLNTLVELVEKFYMLGRKDMNKPCSKQIFKAVWNEAFCYIPDEFFQFVTQETGIPFRKRPEHDDYQKWSMDGSLAYSGVTDDF